MRRRRTLVAVLTAALATSAGGLAALAADGSPPDDVPDGMEWVPGVGLREVTPELDADAIAEATGLSRDEVLVRLRAAPVLDRIIGRVRADFPTFVDVYWRDAVLIAQFKGPVALAAVERLETTGTPVVTEQVRYTAQEFEHLQAYVLVVLLDLGIGAEDLVVAADPSEQRIFATVRSDVLTVEAIRSSLRPDLRDSDVSIEVVDGPVFIEYDRAPASPGAGRLPRAG